MARFHVTLRTNASSPVRLSAVNNNAVARPEFEGDVPAPVSDATVTLTVFDELGAPIAGYTAIPLPAVGVGTASYQAVLPPVTLDAGHYDGEFLIALATGEVDRKRTLVTVSDD